MDITNEPNRFRESRSLENSHIENPAGFLPKKKLIKKLSKKRMIPSPLSP